MMKSDHRYNSFYTSVEMPAGLPRLHQSQQLVLMGSCFATEMGERLQAAKFRCCLNPYGVLYNPLSINTALERIAERRAFGPDELLQHRGLWHSLMHHSSYSSPTADEALDGINRSLSHAADALQQADLLLITWGSAYVYTHRADGKVVGNCHQLPEQQFDRRRLTPDEIVTHTSCTIDTLLALRPTLQVIVTVSPIRHVRDGLHANQLSKSTLLLAADALCTRYPARVHYFPAYELLMDELRDYRFYADDLVHPSPTAIDHVWKRFREACFSPQATSLAAECAPIAKALAHKPFRADSEDYKRFLEQIVLKIDQLNGKYPYLDFENERKLCHTLLMK